MKIVRIISFLIILAHTALAQNSVRVNVIVPPPYPDYLSYYRDQGRMIITLQNMTAVQQEVYLRGAIKGIDNNREIHTKPDYRPGRPIVIPAGIGQTVTVSTAEIQELYRPSNLNFYNTDADRISAADRVGEGTYSICVRVYDYKSPTRPLSADQTGCTTVMMRNLEAPMLIQPLDAANIKFNGIQNVLFSWTQPAGAPVGTTYKLRIVEIFTPDRNPNDAYLSSTAPAFFEKEIPTNVYVYGPSDPALVEGRRYAWAITALDPERARYGRSNYSVFQNQGRSEIRSFTYSKTPIAPVFTAPVQTPAVVALKEPEKPTIVLPATPMTVKSAPSDIVLCECKEAAPQGTPGTLAANDDIKVNSFVMKVVNIESNANGKYTGTGTIPVPLLNNGFVRVRVKFRELEVVQAGAEKKMINGTVKGIRRSDMSFLPTGDAPGFEPAPLSSDNIHAIGTFFEQQKSQVISQIKNAGNSVGFELPIGLDEGPVTIGITEMNFSPTQAWFNAVASMAIPDGNTKAAFEMSGACMKATEFCGQFKLRLKEELNVPSIGMRLVPGNLQGEGTYIVFQKKFLELFLAIDYTFPGGLMDAATHQKATARLNAQTVSGWTNWIASASLPDFYVSGLPALTFSLGQKKIWYDHSDLQNPQQIPNVLKVGNETYTDINTKTWHGFYIPEISVLMPSVIKDIRRPDDKLSISAVQMIIDRNGFTGTVKNTSSPLLDIGNGSMSGWYASIDEINLQFFKSGFRQSAMKGKVVLPGTGEHTASANQLNYTSLLSYSTGENMKYSFNVVPKSNLKFNVLFAEAVITDNSTISIQVDGQNGFLAKTNLNGKISISNLVSADKSPIGLRLPEMELRNFKLQTKSPYWDKEDFFLGFASPQKTMAGFNFTMNKPQIDISLQENNRVLAGLEFSGLLSLIDEGFTCQAGASATIGSVFSFEDHRIKWAGLGGKINEIKFAAGTSMGPFTLEGAIMYYNRNGDEGFVGAVQSGVAGMFNVLMRARFGTTKDNAGAYKYFDFNALADFGQTGIPIAPPIPISFYGFGGGFYYNMRLDNAAAFESIEAKNKVQNAASQAAPKNESGPIALLNYNPAGINLTPSRGAFGLQATVLLGLTSRNTLDADVTLSMGFTASGGVQYVDFTGNVRVLTDVSKPIASRRASSTGAGTLKILYDFEKKSFLASVSAQIGVPNVDQGKWIFATGFLEIASDPGGWHVYAGRPPGIGQGPNSTNLLRKDLFGGNAADFVFTGYSYFEVGSRVDEIPDIPQEVKDLVGYGAKDQSGNLRRPNAAPGRGKYSKQNAGLIVGAHTKFHFGGSFLMFFGELSSMSGFDISIKNEVQCANMPNAGGPGGWYAMGQAYFGAKAKIGIQVNLLLVKGKFTIFDAGAAAVVRAGLPNPTWVDGYVGGYFRILNGAVKGKFNFHVNVGEQCAIAGDPLAGLDIISEISPTTTQELLPLNTESTVLFNLEVGKSFVVEDQTNIDTKGNAKTRIFLFDTECIDATVNDKKVNLQNIGTGEEAGLYYKVPITQINGGSSDYLTKNTNYKFKVTAYLKEATYTLKNGVPELGPFKFISKELGKTLNANENKAKRASKSMEATFRTDDGFEHIPEGDYKETLPVHGRKGLPYAYNDDLILRLNKYFNPAENLKNIGSDAKIYLRLFRNGARVGADLPVTITRGNLKGRFTEFDAGKIRSALLPGSSYVALLVAKNPVQPAGDQIKKTEVSGVLSGVNMNAINADLLSKFEDVRLVKRTGSTRNKLNSGEFIIGGYRFQTSSYATFKDKFQNLKVLDVRNNLPENYASSSSNQPGISTGPSQSVFSNRTINSSTTKSISLAILNSWLPKDSFGNYILHVGHVVNFYAFAHYSGERFSEADVKKNGEPGLFFQDVNKTTIDPGWLEKILQFLSDKTGVPVEKFKIGEDIPLGKIGTECKSFSATYAEFLNTTKIGGPHPVTLPQPSEATSSILSVPMTNMNLSNSSFLPASIISGYKVAAFQQDRTNTYCRELQDLSVTNIIQERINILINARINPGDQMSNKLNQTGVWQSLNQATNAFGQGMNTPQVQQQVNTVIVR